MSGNICPFLSANVKRPCIAEECVMYVEAERKSHCRLAKFPLAATNRLDTLSAQVQEMQIALLEITNKVNG